MPRTALLLIDVQQSFTARPYWSADPARPFVANCNALITGCEDAGLPIVRVLHHQDPDTPDNPFASASGLVRPLDGLRPFQAALTVDKQRHSALVGTLLPVWLREQDISRVIVAGIRTEQCCETTARHASDEGWTVAFCTEATLTFDMITPTGERLDAGQITQRTAAVLAGRFATLVTVQQALARAR